MSCNRAPSGCPGRTCGEVGYNGGSCSAPSVGGRGPGGIGGMLSTYDAAPGRRCACPSPCCYPSPCSPVPCQCPTMACCPQRNSPRSRCESDVVNYCCADPKRRMKPCNSYEPCCRPFPCFPKVCCPCCSRPDPCMKRRCFLPSPCCPPPACGKLCLVPKQCPPSCAPIPVCPPCPPSTNGCCKSCALPVPINPPACIKPRCSGCTGPCCPRPPYGLVPCEGDYPDPYCCPKPTVVVLHCPFKSYPSQKTCT